MADPLPILRNTSGSLNAQCLYPFTRVVSCLTQVLPFQNAAEQRAAQRPPLYGFRLPMSSLNLRDRQAWLNFHTTIIGRFHSDLTLTLGGTTYGNLAAMSDSAVFTQRTLAAAYDQEVVLRQVAAANFTSYAPPAVGQMFPGLAFGFASPGSYSIEYPFVQSSNYLTSVGDSAFGPRFSYSWYNPTAPLTNFPAFYLRSWKVSMPLLNDTDMGAVETFFLGNQGRYGLFGFTDPIVVGTLQSSINSGVTSVSVSDASEIQNGKYISMDLETMKVTSGGGVIGSSTLTVVRAQLGTSGFAHNAGQPVRAAFANVRFDTDDLIIKYLTANQNSTEFTLVETNG